MKNFFMIIVGFLSLSLLSCGGGSGSGSEDEGSGQTVTITGNLSTLVNTQIDATLVRTKVAADENSLLVINETQNTFTLVPVDAAGEFSFDAKAGDAFVIRILGADYENEGTVVSETTSDIVTTGIEASTEATQDLGPIVFDSTTGLATGDSTTLGAYADASHQCSAETDGTPIGGIMGFITEGILDAYTNVIDADGDCVPDVMDGDDDNDAYIDDLDGGAAVGVCGNFDVTLFMNNKIDVSQVSAEETGEFIDIAIHLTPTQDSNIDLAGYSASVVGPAYLDNTEVWESYFYDDSSVVAGSAWDKTLVSCLDASNLCMFVQAGDNLNFAEAMAPGDMFIFTLTNPQGAEQTCVRMINTVFTYTPYNIRIGDDDDTIAELTPVSASGEYHVIEELDGDSDGKLKLAYDIPANMQLGFTPQIEPQAKDTACNPEGEFANIIMSDMDATFTGDTRTVAEEGLENVELIVDLNNPAWPDATGEAWHIDIAFRSPNSDNAAASGIMLKREASPCQ